MSVNLDAAFKGGALCLTKAALAAGTTSTISNTGTITYAIKGQLYTKSAMTNAATPTTDVFTGNAFLPLRLSKAAAGVPEACIIVIGLDASGNVKAAQGPRVAAIDITNGVGAYQFPELPDTVAPIGYILVVAGSTQAADWTFGTSNLSSVTGITFTFRDLMALPAMPITS